MMHDRSFNSAMSRAAILVANLAILGTGFPCPSATARSKQSVGAIKSDSGPCSNPEQFIKDRIAEMKVLQQKIVSADSSRAPTTVAAFLGLSSTPSQELDELTRKLEDVRRSTKQTAEMLSAQGCKLIDVDSEAKKPG